MDAVEYYESISFEDILPVDNFFGEVDSLKRTLEAEAASLEFNTKKKKTNLGFHQAFNINIWHNEPLNQKPCDDPTYEKLCKVYSTGVQTETVMCFENADFTELEDYLSTHTAPITTSTTMQTDPELEVASKKTDYKRRIVKQTEDKVQRKYRKLITERYMQRVTDFGKLSLNFANKSTYMAYEKVVRCSICKRALTECRSLNSHAQHGNDVVKPQEKIKIAHLTSGNQDNFLEENFTNFTITKVHTPRGIITSDDLHLNMDISTFAGTESYRYSLYDSNLALLIYKEQEKTLQKTFQSF